MSYLSLLLSTEQQQSLVFNKQKNMHDQSPGLSGFNKGLTYPRESGRLLSRQSEPEQEEGKKCISSLNTVLESF